MKSIAIGIKRYNIDNILESFSRITKTSLVSKFDHFSRRRVECFGKVHVPSMANFRSQRFTSFSKFTENQLLYAHRSSPPKSTKPVRGLVLWNPQLAMVSNNNKNLLAVRCGTSRTYLKRRGTTVPWEHRSVGVGRGGGVRKKEAYGKSSAVTYRCTYYTSPSLISPFFFFWYFVYQTVAGTGDLIQHPPTTPRPTLSAVAFFFFFFLV